MSSSKKESIKLKLQLLEKRALPSFEDDFQSIYADLDTLEEPSLQWKVWLKRFIKTLVMIVILKISRKLMTTSSQKEMISPYFKDGNGIDLLYAFLPVIALTIFVMLCAYILFNSKPFTELLQKPLVIGCITFLTIDLILIVVFPDITLAIVKAYLKID